MESTESSPLRVHILTLFPGFFESPLETSIAHRAIESERLAVHVHDIREQARDKHHSADDTPYGGGPGMVMKPEPIVRAIEAVEADFGRQHRIFLSPQGAVFTQRVARRLSQTNGFLLLCGHYEGVDERVREYIDEELSIGDFVLTGGEVAALAILDAVSRLRPGVLGNAASAVAESFTNEVLLDHPHYTRPASFRGVEVPEVLRGGNHALVDRWRRQQALLRTRERRPDLFARLLPTLSEADKTLLAECSNKGRNGSNPARETETSHPREEKD